MAKRKGGSPADSCVSAEGLGALKKSDRNKLDMTDLVAHESVNIDKCFEPEEPNEPRWDYYIGTERGAIYVEVHEVSEKKFAGLIAKAAWLREKIDTLNWPAEEGRPLIVAPTKGIAPFAVYGQLSRLLALQKIMVVMKGDRIADKIN